MRIAVLVPTPPWVVHSGLETVAFESAKNLVKLGHDVDMICIRSDERITETRDGVRVLYAGKKIDTKIPAIDHLLNSLTHLFTSHRGVEGNYDVIYAHKGVAVPQLLWKIPVVKYSYGEFLHWSPVTLTNTAIDMFDIYTSNKVIVCSDFAKKQIENFPRMRGRVEMITPGTYTKIFRPAAKDRKLQKMLGLKNSDKVVIFAGRVTDSKGCGDLVDIAEMVVKKNKNAKFLFVGKYEKNYLSALLKKASLAGIDSSLIFAGDVDYYSMPKYYAISQVQVLPSHMEAFGMVNIEAQSCGIPSIAYDIGGVGSSIEDGVTGYLVGMKNKTNFASKINVLLSNERLRKKMGAAGRKRATANFDWSIIAKKIENVLDGVRK
jgi:glycosyltransferase involved in cell wall biosynthesis